MMLIKKLQNLICALVATTLVGENAADLDARVVRLVELVEVHAKVARRGQHLHGHVHEPEAE